MPDPGSVIGPYEILREIGRGGMGVVFLARDTRLDRQVAVKALPEGLVSDPGRLERFEREGKALAQLSHPNIAGIYGVEEHEGRKYLILEFVEGDTLGERLEGGPIPVEEAVEFAVGIASGLEAAHEVGIIHRDLKPDNIKVTPEGTIKVLDFGLAKTSEGVGSSSDANLSNSPTITTPRSPTIPGAIMGTAAYMSPEQARGRRVDKRTDIWSFGVVLYEMLTGASPFVGETASDSIGAVLHKGVDLRRLPPSTPVGVRRVLERCLERDKSLRYRDIGDVRIELLRTGDERDVQTSPQTAPSRVGKFALAAMCVVALIAGAGWYLAAFHDEPRERTVRKYDLMWGTVESPLNAERARISPDGTRIAFVRDELVYVRDFASFEARLLSGTDGASTVFWSPDSKWIGYTTEDSIYKVALLGGGAIKVADAESSVGWDIGGGWTSDDRIIYREDDSIAQVAARGGKPTPYLMVDKESEVDFHSPTVIPGSDVVLFIEHRRSGAFALAAYDGKKRVVLTVSEDLTIDSPTYSPSGDVLFVRGFSPRSLWAIGFDPRSMSVTSEPFLVLPDASQPSVANDGTLVVHRGDAAQSGQLVFAGLDGKIEPVGDPFDMVVATLLSPDETKIALSTGRPGKFDVWVHDLERGSRNRITFTEALTFPAAWSSDSAELAVVTLGFGPGASRPTTSFYAADGSGQTRPSVDTGIMSLDAGWTVGVSTDDPMSQDPGVTAISLDNPADRSSVIKLSDDLRGIAILNPAGTLLAYTSYQSGDNQVYCTRFPSGSGRWQVSVRSGANPLWSADGSMLYFQSDDDEKKIYAVEVVTEPAVRFGIPQEVLDAGSLGLDLNAGWSVTADGQRFLALKADVEAANLNSISVIENWHEEYRDR
jgi:Tol biopolymer transport system component